MQRFIYIAGPYTKPDPAVNTAKAMAMWHRLHELGFVPFCPHLSHFLHIHKERPYREWMEHDFAWIQKCDALLRMPGESSGADEEVQLALELGIQVFHSVEDLVDYFAD